MTQQSSLPRPEEIKDQQTMKIVRVFLDNFPSTIELLYFDIVDKYGNKQPVAGEVYKIDDQRVKSYLPTKAWWNSSRSSIEMLFYVSDFLPERAKPFNKQDMYVVTIPVSTDEVIEYDVDTTVFIDQVFDENRVSYMFIFGQDQYDKIVRKEKDDVFFTV